MTYTFSLPHKLITAAICTMLVVAAQAQRSQASRPKYNTLAHRLLQKEADLHLLGSGTSQEFAEYGIFVDGLIDSAAAHIGTSISVRGRAINPQDSLDALLVLNAVDEVLCAAHVVVCIKLELLSDGLKKRALDQFPCVKYRCGGDVFPKLPMRNDWRGLDCDLGAMIYVSIGEALGYPISMVEVPDHNFARWHFSKDRYLNWDNNSAQALTDDDFRSGRSATSHHAFTKDEEERLHYLESMTTEFIVQYHAVMLAIALGKEKRFKEAEGLYESAINSYRYSALALNNLAWMYVTEVTMSDKERTAKALDYAMRADSLDVNNVEYRDTYSCVCAANGQFDRAIEIEKRARNKPERLAAYGQRRTCLDIGEQ